MTGNVDSRQAPHGGCRGRDDRRLQRADRGDPGAVVREVLTMIGEHVPAPRSCALAHWHP